MKVRYSHGIPLAFLLVLTVLFQNRVLERRPEKQIEAESADLSRLPASSMLPQYAVSLFIGSLRALAVYYLWTEYTETIEQEEYHRTLQIMNMITALQPRNDDVWTFLSWNVAYNLAANEDTPQKRWSWIKAAIVKLREGVRLNERSIPLKFELALRIYHRASNEPPNFPMNEYIVPFMNDRELQELLSVDGSPSHSLSPFEVAVNWFRKTRDQLMRQTPENSYPYVYTNSGSLIDLWGIDSFIRDALYLQAILEWKYLNNIPKARQTLTRAVEHLKACEAAHKVFAEDCVRMQEIYLRFRDALGSLETLATHDTPEQRLKVLKDMEAIFRDNLYSDDMYIRTWLGPFKQLLGGDIYEFNDQEDIHPTPVPSLSIEKATIGPLRTDRDCYRLNIPPPLAQRLPRPARLILRQDDAMALKVRIRAGPHEIVNREFSGGTNTIDLTVEPDRTQWRIVIEHPGGAAPWSATATYSFRLEIP